jgi:hypothetical protein
MSTCRVQGPSSGDTRERAKRAGGVERGGGRSPLKNAALFHKGLLVFWCSLWCSMVFPHRNGHFSLIFQLLPEQCG